MPKHILFTPIDQAIQEFAAGNFVVVADDEDRENEGDLILAAEKTTTEKVAFMVRATSGIICVPMLPRRLDELRLPPMVSNNTESMRTAFAVSVDYRRGTTTGVSAADRTKTILALADPATAPEDFAHPGHVFPLKYCDGGVLRRSGHTEAAVDLARLAGLRPVGVLAELVADDGSMMRLGDLEKFATTHRLSLISIAELIAYRHTRENLVRRVTETRLRSGFGDFKAVVYEWLPDGTFTLALVLGDIAGQDGILVRVHHACLAGDVFQSSDCGCRASLDRAFERISAEGEGVVIYLNRHDKDLPTDHRPRVRADTDARDLGIGAQILADLQLRELRLLTDSSVNYRGLKGFGLEVVERVPLKTAADRPLESDGRGGR